MMERFAKFTYWLALFSVWLLLAAIGTGSCLFFLSNDGFLFLAAEAVITYLLSILLIFIYELSTLYNSCSEKAREDKKYKNQLVWKKVLGLLNLPLVFLVVAYIFHSKEDGLFFIVFIPLSIQLTAMWVGMASRTEYSSSINSKGIDINGLWGFTISIVLVMGLVFGSVGVYKYFSQTMMFRSEEPEKAIIYFTKRGESEREAALLKTYWKKNTPLHISLQNKFPTDTTDVILAVAFEHRGDLFEKIITAKNAKGQKPEDLLANTLRERFEIEIDAMKTARLIENYSIADKEIISRIEKEKIYINTYFPMTNKTLFNYAAETYRLDLAKYLISKGSSPNNQYTPFEASYSEYELDRDGLTTSLYKICKGNLRRPGTYNNRQPYPETPQQKTFKERIYNVIKLLLENGADPNIPNESGSTPFTAVAENSDDLNIIKLFFEHDANPNVPAKGGSTPFMKACAYSNNPEIIRLFMEKGADINVHNSSGTTPFMFVCGNIDSPDTIKLFIDRRANPKIRNKNGQGVIEFWYNNRNKRDFAVLNMLIKAGADPFERRDIIATPSYIDPKFINISFYEQIKKIAWKGSFEEQVLNFLEKYK